MNPSKQQKFHSYHLIDVIKHLKLKTRKMWSWSAVDEAGHQILEVLFHFEKEAVTVKHQGNTIRLFYYQKFKTKHLLG